MTPEDLVDAQAVLAYMKDPNSIGQFNVETLMAAMQLWVEGDKANYIKGAENGDLPHSGVLACLDACIEHIQDARMAYYCSLK